MLEQLARQARDAVAATGRTELPPEVLALAQESVSKTREAYAKWAIGAEKGAKALEEAIQLARTGAKTVGDEALGNVLANAEAALDAADALARAKTVQDALQLQTKFVEKQLAVFSEQGKSLLELSLRVATGVTNGIMAIAASAAASSEKAPA